MIDLQERILAKYGRPEEYLIDRYTPNFFDYYIDIGTRGVVNPWHINYIGSDSPRTKCFGYEPDLPYFKELVSAVDAKGLSNVYLHSEGFGTGKEIKTPQGTGGTVTLSEIFNEYELDPSETWAIKFDCEGAEYALLEKECEPCVDILKQADHISLEFHVAGGGSNFFTVNNQLPSSFEKGESWMFENFSDSHEIFLTSYEERLKLKTYVLLSDKIMSLTDSLFWKELL